MWLIPYLLLNLFNVVLSASFFARFCANYWRASGPGDFKEYTSNVNEGDTCLMKFNFHPNSNQSAGRICEELAPFTVREGYMTGEGMTCLYGTKAHCATDNEIMIWDQCLIINKPQDGPCKFGEAAIEGHKQKKWLSLLLRQKYTYLSVAVASQDFYDVMNPESVTDHLALHLTANSAAKLIYIPRGVADKSPKLCQGDHVTNSAENMESYCKLVGELGVSTYYDTNMCYVATSSYYPLKSFNEGNKRCNKIFGDNANYAPDLTDIDFQAANQVLKKMKAADGHYSAFGTVAFVNDKVMKIGHERITRKITWGTSAGLPRHLFQYENDFNNHFIGDKLSFHYGSNNYSSLLIHNSDFHVRQLCKIGKGADMFVPRPGACKPEEAPFVTDRGDIKCLAKKSTSTWANTLDGANDAFCGVPYQISSFESFREYNFFIGHIRSGTHTKVNVQYEYAQHNQHLSRYTWSDGRVVVFNNFNEWHIDGTHMGEEENCIQSMQHHTQTWNDLPCDKPGKFSVYCTRYPK